MSSKALDSGLGRNDAGVGTTGWYLTSSESDSAILAFLF
jgi:hypothetical protein